MLQVVYVLTNPAMPGFVKIGKTYSEDVSIRISQLYSTGVPFPFDLAYACRVQNADEVERALHRAFSPNRVNPKREFFKIDPEQAIAILKLLHVQDATSEIASQTAQIDPEDIEASKIYKSRRPNLDFAQMGIPVGSILHFTDSDAIVSVISNKKVSYNGVETSLTAITRELLGLDYSVAPGAYWEFEGKSISTIYDETYT